MKSNFDFKTYGYERYYNDDEEIPYNRIMEDQIAAQIGYVKRIVDELNLMIEEYYASHWRDDDCPIAEESLGTKRAA